jgi:hypothetical protein
MPTVRLPYEDVNDASVLRLARLLERRRGRGTAAPVPAT